LIQLVPLGVGSGIDAALVTVIQNIREDRAKEFFDEFGKGKIDLPPELLESEDFLHCFFRTTKAALNSRRREKIRMFARLLNSSARPDSFSSVDEYEEYLGILDEISYREFLALSILEKYESEIPSPPDESDFQRAGRFWESFLGKLQTKLNIPRNEIDSFLARMNRTGCYETYVGTYIGYTGGRGRLTVTYFRLKE
jgi:hypothetical protein